MKNPFARPFPCLQKSCKMLADESLIMKNENTWKFLISSLIQKKQELRKLDRR